jgi:saccharopine dehydrogenase-like NADP-dependent oxidoreductase
MAFARIAVLGLGRVGALVARLLHECGFEVTGIDARAPSRAGPHPVVQADLAATHELNDLLRPYEAVLSCLPYALNLEVATSAHRLGLHYFDLTEDVPTTQAIREMSETATAVMAPQCGLAPGFVGIVGASLAAGFDRLRSIRLRIGALPQHPTGLLGYAFNWSPAGVVNEYLNDCEVIEEGQHKWVSPMEWIETVYVNGVKLEAFTTSGGLGTMCDTYLGTVKNLDYKTLRYPGHMKLMNFFFHELLMREKRELAGQILTHAKPPVDDDVVHLHVSAEGFREERLQRQEFVRSYYPRELCGERWTAIAWTTSASACAVIEMVNEGTLPEKGFIRQEEIPLQAFLRSRSGGLYGE